jgi:hypothetical protein
MKHRKRKTFWAPLTVLIVFGIISYSGYIYFKSQKTQANIFAITPSVITYGNATVTGVLRKDSAVEESGNYLLILDDSRPILLDVKGLNHLLGNKVSISGYLLEENTQRPLFMKVTEITLLEK